MNQEESSINVIVIGAGQRGNSPFGDFALSFPEKMKVVAVIEPEEYRRQSFAQKHNIPEKYQYESVKDFLKSKSKPRTKAAINATSDKKHLQTTLPLIKKGYKILLEKPMATTKRSCVRIFDEALESESYVMVCHVLRYAPIYAKVKDILKSEILGKILSIEHEESIGDWHFAHSYVRGNWGLKRTSGPISLTKTCHDFDLFEWFTGKDKVMKIRSVADPLFFKQYNAPYQKVPDRCTKKCKIYDKCNYSVDEAYFSHKTSPFMLRAIDVSMDLTKIRKELITSKFGRCVYKCDNNVPDLQKTEITYKSGLKIYFSMTGRKSKTNRQTFVFGTKGKMSADLEKGEITLEIGNTIKKVMVNTGNSVKGHGGGDNRLIDDFLKVVRKSPKAQNKTSIKNSLQSHLIAFAAEDSRLKGGEEIDFGEFVKENKFINNKSILKVKNALNILKYDQNILLEKLKK